MKTNLLLWLYILGNQALLAQDSLSQTSIQALDISVDMIENSSSYPRELQLVNQLVDQQFIYPNLNRSDVKAFSYTKRHIRANIDLVLYGKDLNLMKRRFKTEFKFGLSYCFSNLSLSKGSRWQYENYDQAGNLYKTEIQFKYFCHQEQIQLAYLLNSKAFAKHFKVYAGLGIGAMLSTWSKGGNGSDARYQVNGFTFPINKYSTTAFAAWLPFGIKYNLSCDLNVFTEGKIGGIYTPQLTSKALQSSYAFCLGFRLKFGQTETDIRKQNSFW